MANLNSKGFTKINRVLLTTVNPQTPTGGIEDLDLTEVQTDQETKEVEEIQDQIMVIQEMKDQEVIQDLIEVMEVQEAGEIQEAMETLGQAEAMRVLETKDPEEVLGPTEGTEAQEVEAI